MVSLCRTGFRYIKLGVEVFWSELILLMQFRSTFGKLAASCLGLGFLSWLITEFPYVLFMTFWTFIMFILFLYIVFPTFTKTSLTCFDGRQQQINFTLGKVIFASMCVSSTSWPTITRPVTTMNQVVTVLRWTAMHSFSKAVSLYNIRKMQPSCSTYTSQLLFISHFNYCSARFTILPTCPIKPVHMIQNTAAHLIFDQSERTHHTNVCTLHWLLVAGSKLWQLV